MYFHWGSRLWNVFTRLYLYKLYYHWGSKFWFRRKCTTVEDRGCDLLFFFLHRKCTTWTHRAWTTSCSSWPWSPSSSSQRSGSRPSYPSLERKYCRLCRIWNIWIHEYRKSAEKLGVLLSISLILKKTSSFRNL